MFCIGDYCVNINIWLRLINWYIYLFNYSYLNFVLIQSTFLWQFVTKIMHLLNTEYAVQRKEFN